MPRRFELSIGPLLARLGFTRPDEDPLQAHDLVNPTMVLADFRSLTPSPGSRFQVAVGRSDPVALSFSSVLFDPPAGGTWLHSIFATTDAGSFVRMSTSNQIANPALIANGVSFFPFRPDNRESALNPAVTVGTTVAALVSGFRNTGLFPPVPIWWAGTQILVQCEGLAEGVNVSLIHEPPLEGMRRQTS